MPVKATVCGLPLALSVMLTDAVRVPAAVGANLTLIVQLAAAATLLPQLFVCEKSPAFVPLRAMLVILNAPVPESVRVTDCAALVVLTF